ncbi:hypothetical protein [Streptomyces sp. NPDC058623]|uniref:hypothetical protein n=1 Tax=Streptomyces sp. NPDC058623 TaxID=3346563 RepID=UPI003664B5D4
MAPLLSRAARPLGRCAPAPRPFRRRRGEDIVRVGDVVRVEDIVRVGDHLPVKIMDADLPRRLIALSHLRALAPRGG